MLGIILGIFTIMLGIKGFTEKGLPWSRTKNIAGTPAKVIGAGCLMFGVGMVAERLLGIEVDVLKPARPAAETETCFSWQSGSVGSLLATLLFG